MADGRRCAAQMVMCYELPGGVAYIFGFPVRMQTEMWAELLLYMIFYSSHTSVTAHLRRATPATPHPTHPPAQASGATKRRRPCPRAGG